MRQISLAIAYICMFLLLASMVGMVKDSINNVPQKTWTLKQGDKCQIFSNEEWSQLSIGEDGNLVLPKDWKVTLTGTDLYLSNSLGQNVAKLSKEDGLISLEGLLIPRIRRVP